MKIRPKRFIQYNDLVFDGTESINSAPSFSISTKYYSEKYLLKNGDYVASDDEPLLNSYTISLDLAIRTSTWDLYQAQSHVDFIKEQLIHRGKLWAIDTGGQLVYANAILNTYSPTNEWTLGFDGYIQFTCEFNIYEGVWHKAKGEVTWLVPYNFCSFINIKSNCYVNKDCTACELPSQIVDGTCNDCELGCCELKDAISLCEMTPELYKAFYKECSSDYRVVHNCELGRETFGDERMLGEAYCDTCLDGQISYTFISDTVLNSKHNRITLYGSFKDPEITINDIKVKLNGVYNQGYITIDSNGKIYTYNDLKELKCGEAKEVDYNTLTFCDNEWWTIHSGANQITIRGITSNSVCVFVNYERLTY